jgi:amidophosphoribosyltransferase
MHTATGFAEASGFKRKEGILRSHYAGRGFLEPDQGAREKTAKYKYSVVEAIIRDRRVVLIDDSLVRGTTLRKLIRMIRLMGPLEVIVLIACPRVIHPCLWGIDTPTFKELVAASHTTEEITHTIEADFLGYLELEQYLACFPNNGKDFCSTCFTGKAPCKDKIPPEKLCG